MTLTRTLAALALAASAPLAAAQDVELYDRPDFGGTRLTVGQPVPDLHGFGMTRQVSSVVVRRGQWEFCTAPQWRGTCITVGPGRYGRLPPQFNDNVASLRPAADKPGGPVVTPPTRPEPPRPPVRPEPPRQATVVLYGEAYPGQELRVTGSEPDLRRHAFNDTARTIDVLSGVWELCTDGGFQGQCQTYGPGRHTLAPVMRDRVSSLRPQGAGPDRPPRPGGPHEPGRPGGPYDPGRPGGPFDPGRPGGPDGPGRPWPSAAPAIVLYEHRDGGGRSLALHQPISNLYAQGFNDRASSVEVLRGRWQLCRHADFQGECVVFGPGRHNLDGPLGDNVSSLRPVWGRDDRTQHRADAVTLYEREDLRGRSVYVDDPVENLRELDFNDRAVAIEVHGGRWELCSSSGGRGRCMTFGPGWHRLPNGLARELSSLRPR